MQRASAAGGDARLPVEAADWDAGAAAEPNQKPKRSFEDIMGGGAATSLGFGSPVVVPQGFGKPAGSTFPAATIAGDGPPRLYGAAVCHARSLHKKASPLNRLLKGFSTLPGMKTCPQNRCTVVAIHD